MKKIQVSNEEYPFHENNYIFQEGREKGLGKGIEKIPTETTIVLVFLSLLLKRF